MGRILSFVKTRDRGIILTMEKKTCFLLVVHGSMHASAREGTEAFSRNLASLDLPVPARLCFLRMGKPTLPDLMQEALTQGFERVVVFPLLVFAGQHLAEEIPGILAEFRRTAPGVSIELRPPLAEGATFLAWLRQELIGLLAKAS